MWQYSKIQMDNAQILLDATQCTAKLKHLFKVILAVVRVENYRFRNFKEV